MEYSTLQNIVTEEPLFPLGENCGKYRFLPGSGVIQGGLRTQGKYKKSRADKPLVSFVTVVRNNTDTLPRCMESVWRQTYDNVEYIVLDGASTDGTLKLIEANSGLIDYYASEPDKGIYNAMDKALTVTSGEIINIINSDDWLEPNAAQDVANAYLETHFDFLAGAGRVYNPDGQLAYPWYSREIHMGIVFFGMPIIHEAIFATRRCYEIAGVYDDTYGIAADHKWISMVVKHKLKIHRIEQMVINYMLGGASADGDKHVRERLHLIREHFPCLSDGDARTLFMNLDVAEFYRTMNQPNDFAVVYQLLEKYSSECDLLRAVAEAMIMRYKEFYKVRGARQS